MRHLKGCPRISASSSLMRPRRASTTGAPPSGSLLASRSVAGEDVDAPASSFSCPGSCEPPGLVDGSALTSTCWTEDEDAGLLVPLGEMTASRRASRSFCSRAEPSCRGVTTSASVYWVGPNWAVSSPSTTRSTSSSSGASELLAPFGPPLLELRLLDDVASPAAESKTRSNNSKQRERLSGGGRRLTGKSTDEHRRSSDSPLSGPLVLLEGLAVALDVDLLVVASKVPVGIAVVLVKASLDVQVKLLRRARQTLAAHRTRRLVRLSLTILYSYSRLRKSVKKTLVFHTHLLTTENNWDQ